MIFSFLTINQMDYTNYNWLSKNNSVLYLTRPSQIRL